MDEKSRIQHQSGVFLTVVSVSVEDSGRILSVESADGIRYHFCYPASGMKIDRIPSVLPEKDTRREWALFALVILLGLPVCLWLWVQFIQLAANF